MHRPRHRLTRLAMALLLWASPALAELSLFDAHLHYDAGDALRFSPADIVEILDRSGIRRGLVNGTPALHTRELYTHAPGRIVPLLNVYRTDADKGRWYRDTTLPDWVESQLDKGPWRGVGELHLFAEHRRSPVFAEIVSLAAARGLPLQMHCDPPVIDVIFELAPDAIVIWAHAGAYPYPPLLRDYLRRHPSLYVDLSMRDERVAPGGRLDEEWELLFFEYADRFLTGVDTHSTARWKAFDAEVNGIRRWLMQLPAEEARQIGHDNAERLFPHPP